MIIKQGYTKWARQTIESKIYQEKPDKWFKIFFYLVMRANHKTNKYNERGGNWVKYSLIMEYTGATKGQVDHFFRWIKKEGTITTKKSTRGLHFTIVNYDKYQNGLNYERDIGAKNRRNRRDTINNNEKNDKNDNLGKGKFYIGTSNEDNQAVYLVEGKYRTKGADGEFYDFGGDINKIKKFIDKTID